MFNSLAFRLTGVLAVMFAFGTASVASAPDGSHIGYMWPVGLASGVLALTPKRSSAYVAVAIAVLATLSFALGNYPFGVSLGFGVGILVEGIVAQQVLTAGWTRSWSMI